MNDILGITLQGIRHDVARLDRLAFNLANAQTVGFKRDTGFAAQLARAGAAQPGAPGAAIDLRPGTLRATGAPLDLALSGPGWFEIDTPQGPAYTRAGAFQLDAQGRLVTAQGLPVAGAGGEIVLTHPRPLIDAQGRVFDSTRPGSAPVAQLKIARFDALAVVQRRGDGLIAITGEPDLQDSPAAAVQVHQGHLENANVSAMHEMVQLMHTVRHLETLQKLALTRDELLGNAIRKLGDPA